MSQQVKGWTYFKACRLVIAVLSIPLIAAIIFPPAQIDSATTATAISAFLVVGLILWSASILYTTFWPCPRCGKCFATGFIFVLVTNIPFRNSCFHCGYEPATGSIREEPD